MVDVTTNPPPGTPTWVDLGIPDLQRAKEFYGTLFGWEFDEGPPETGHYTMCLVRGRPAAAIMPNPDTDATSFWWNLSFATDDCDGTAKRITDAGGRLVTPPMDVMDVGRMAIVVDPTGAQFGLWEGRAHHGAAVVNEPGAMVWNELVTPGAAAARPFYTAVFDYSLEAMEAPDVDYTVIRRPDGHEVGGIHGQPDATSSSWLTYFQVDDADAAVQRAVDSGGTSEGEPQDSPYGRIAAIRDPFGAEFRIVRPPDNAPET